MLPIGQSEHAAAPAELYLLAPHCVCTVAVQKCPATHWVHDAAPAAL